MTAQQAWIDQEILPEGRELSFGQFLRRERILRGIPVDDILKVTKVSPEYYDALETNTFKNLPHKAFVVGFLRVLSKYAGMDSDELINRFLAQYYERTNRDEITETDANPGFWRRNWKKLAWGGFSVCLIILMLLPLF